MSRSVDNALWSSLHSGRVENFIDSREAKNIVEEARGDGFITTGERAQLLELVRTGSSFFDDDLFGTTPELNEPTLSVPATRELVSGLAETDALDAFIEHALLRGHVFGVIGTESVDDLYAAAAANGLTDGEEQALKNLVGLSGDRPRDSQWRDVQLTAAAGDRLLKLMLPEV